MQTSWHVDTQEKYILNLFLEVSLVFGNKIIK